MYKYEISKRIENFAPLETQEDWDCSGWAVDTKNNEHIHKIMLCLTPTNDVIKQAKSQNCDIIISHHPCFCIPIEWADINIYCAHTNLDKAKGGTTDTLINTFLDLIQNLSQEEKIHIKNNIHYEEFLRILKFEKPLSISEFSNIIRQISPNARLVNNHGIKGLKKIAFCAGSGSEFIQQAQTYGADCFVTGDLKFHTALDSEIAVYDIGHFESEVLVLPKIQEIIGDEAKIIIAKEKSPFEQI